MLHIDFSPFPTLTTERLHVRSLTENDAEALFFLRSDDRVMRYIERPRAKSIEDAKQLIIRINLMIASNESINWGITLKSNDVLIGMISFHRIEKENYRGEIGYLLHPDFQRQGILNEAIRPVIEYGFGQLKFHSIEALVNPDNTASRGLLEKHGFVQEGNFRENLFFEGKFYDSVVYSLLSPYPFETA